MKKHYDFSKARRNPYAKRLKKQVTLRIDEGTLAYFRDLADRVGVLDKGNLVAFGSVDEVSQSENEVARKLITE